MADPKWIPILARTGSGVGHAVPRRELGGHGSVQRTDSLGERGGRTVARPLQDGATVPGDRIVEDRVVRLQGTCHGFGEVRPQAGALLDVGEEEGEFGVPLQGHLASLGPEHERRVVVEDPALEVGELTPGLDAHVLREVAAGPLVGPQGVALPAAPVERQHELRPQPLVEGMKVNQRFQCRDRVGGTTQSQDRVVATFQRIQADGVESPGLSVRPPDARELGQRWSAPPSERHIEPGQPTCGLGDPTGHGHGALESLGIDVCGSDLERVAARTSLEASAILEELAKLGHVGLDRAVRAVRGLLTPQLVHQEVGAQRVARVDDQAGQEPAPLWSTNGELSTRSDDFERTEDPELHTHPSRGPGA